VVGTIALVVLGGVFVVAAVAKFAGWESWRNQSAGMGVAWTIASVVPTVELLIGALAVATVARVAVAWSAVGVLVMFTALLVVRLRQGRRPPCACFGALQPKPIGWGHVARNLAFIALGLVAALG
jgi:hypothetical protein